MQPMTRFNSPQATFTVGDDNPFPGGGRMVSGNDHPKGQARNQGRHSREAFRRRHQRSSHTV